MHECLVAPHPLLEVAVRTLDLPTPIASVPGLAEAVYAGAAGPTDLAITTAVRALLRHGGYKPSGRGKPASEYLLAAHADGRFPRINPVVDLFNLASCRSGLPVSLLDRAALRGRWHIEVMPPGTSYVFNPAGQTIDASGLLAFCDDDGACGTAVKDAQRTKTSGETEALLAIVWGSVALPGAAHALVAWLDAALTAHGLASTVAVPVCPGA